MIRSALALSLLLLAGCAHVQPPSHVETSAATTWDLCVAEVCAEVTVTLEDGAVCLSVFGLQVCRPLVEPDAALQDDHIHAPGCGCAEAV